MAFIKTSPQFGSSPSGAHLQKISASGNFENGIFVNQIPTSMDMGLGGMLGTIYEFAFKDGDRKPGAPLPVKFDSKAGELPADLAKVTWYGHSAILIEIDAKQILIDPMLGNAASPFSFMTNRFEYQKPIDLRDIPQVDAVVLSHDHYDHLDYRSILKLKDRVGHFYTPLGVGAHLERWGVPAERITELDWWESLRLDQIRLIATPARHFSGRGISDRNKTQWASWVIEGENEKFYFSGDSGYGPHFKEIGEKYGPFDFAMMECGQYNTKWEAIHMMPEQTIQASKDIGAKSMMPIHWSAFNLSLHSWIEPAERALKAAESQEVHMVTPGIGLRFAPGMFHEKNPWWRAVEGNSNK